jgi:hypothetical protein
MVLMVAKELWLRPDGDPLWLALFLSLELGIFPASLSLGSLDQHYNFHEKIIVMH